MASVYVLPVGGPPEGVQSASDCLRALGATVLRLKPEEVRARQGVSMQACVVVEIYDRLDAIAPALADVHMALPGNPTLLVVSERCVAQMGNRVKCSDFVVAPFFASELYARIARLSAPADADSEPPMRVGALLLDASARRALIGGLEVALTRKEFDLICELVRHQGRLMRRGALLERVWGQDYTGGERTVDIHIARLRTKLKGSVLLEPVRGEGYVLKAQ